MTPTPGTKIIGVSLSLAVKSIGNNISPFHGAPGLITSFHYQLAMKII